MLPTVDKPSLGQREGGTATGKVAVAVKAEKVISSTALAWALAHVIRAGDCILLLAVLPCDKSGRRFWNFPRLTGDCRNGQQESLQDRICEISESCSQMILPFHDRTQVKVRIKVVSDTLGGAVAAEAKDNGAHWVILDKKLKKELKHCLEELRCNIVMMKGIQAKVFRLNLGCQTPMETTFVSAASSPVTDVESSQDQRMKHSTPVNSPEEQTSCYTRTSKALLISNESMSPPFLVYEKNPLFEGVDKGSCLSLHKAKDLDELYVETDLERQRLITPTIQPTSSGASNHKSVLWIPQNHPTNREPPITCNCNTTNQVNISRPCKTLHDKFVRYDLEMKAARLSLEECTQVDYATSTSIRDAVSLARTSSMPPPLCSICQHKTPVFGKPPRRFSYRQLVEATDGFSDANLLAESASGFVHRGVLRDGRVVAVKQLGFTGSDGDANFCREVQILSCAQHRNVVLLAGFCIEDKKRVLVYEYICNRSLDFHLHGNKKNPLDWHSRLRIAIGVARGLRYLHEDCRLGCIVHRDVRPNNILLTHDFEPLIGGFGFARWLSEEDINLNHQIIRTSGYLAPEYVDGGVVTEKVDVYAFGMILLELMTGQNIAELQFCQGRHSLSDWFHPLASLEPNQFLMNNYQLLDPFVVHQQFYNFENQLQAVIRAASLCVHRDPKCRPAMSKILRILEGGDVIAHLALDLNSIGNRSGHLRGLASHDKLEMSKTHSRTLSH